jgi:hypothetical protein
MMTTIPTSNLNSPLLLLNEMRKLQNMAIHNKKMKRVKEKFGILDKTMDDFWETEKQ